MEGVDHDEFLQRPGFLVSDDVCVTLSVRNGFKDEIGCLDPRVFKWSNAEKFRDLLLLWCTGHRTKTD
eukprot:4685661-Amphidinium_carterae.1